MMRWKWFAAIGALTVVILIATIYVYLNTYGYNKLKPRITRLAKDATGRDLNLSGEIDLAIGPIEPMASFVNLGANQNHPGDVQSIGQLGLNIPANKQ